MSASLKQALLNMPSLDDDNNLYYISVGRMCVKFPKSIPSITEIKFSDMIRPYLDADGELQVGDGCGDLNIEVERTADGYICKLISQSPDDVLVSLNLDGEEVNTIFNNNGGSAIVVTNIVRSEAEAAVEAEPNRYYICDDEVGSTLVTIIYYPK